MIRLFVHHVLGGRSGKREAAWFMFIVVTGMVAFVVWAEYNGVAMPISQAILTIVWPATVLAVGAAHGIEHYGGSDLLDSRRITIEGAHGVPEMTLEEERGRAG